MDSRGFSRLQYPLNGLGNGRNNIMLAFTSTFSDRIGILRDFSRSTQATCSSSAPSNSASSGTRVSHIDFSSRL